MTGKTYSDENIFKKSHIGLMFFDTGEIYVGEFDNEFKFHGEGMFIFSVGSILWGKFEHGKVDGCSFIMFSKNQAALAFFN